MAGLLVVAKNIKKGCLTHQHLVTKNHLLRTKEININQISFCKDYVNIATEIASYYHNLMTMSVPQRAEKIIENQKDMNNLFIEKLKDEMTGQNVDIFV